MANSFKQTNLVFLILTWGLAIALFPLLPTIAAVWPHGDQGREPSPRPRFDLDDLILAGALLRNSGQRPARSCGSSGGGLGTGQPGGGGGQPSSPLPEAGPLVTPVAEENPPQPVHENPAAAEEPVVPRATPRPEAVNQPRGAVEAVASGDRESTPLAGVTGQTLARREDHFPVAAVDVGIGEIGEQIADVAQPNDANDNGRFRGYTIRVPISNSDGGVLYHEGSLVFPDEVLADGIRIGTMVIPWDNFGSEDGGGER